MTDLQGRHFLVTGANTGIGKETVRGLALRGAQVTLAGRSEEKTRAAMAEVLDDAPGADLDFLQLDLGNLDSVRRAAGEFLGRDQPLHVLVNNAGLAGARGMSESGFEVTFGVNHVGPFLFTQLLLDRIQESGPGGRVVNVASQAHFQAPGIDWEAVRRPTRTTTGLAEYAVSKLANVLHAQELGRRLEGTGVTAYSLHPGVIASDVWRKVPFGVRHVMKLFMKSPAEGAKTSLHCATSPDVAGDTGRYYDDSRATPASPLATPELAAELWRRSEQWVAEPSRA